MDHTLQPQLAAKLETVPDLVNLLRAPRQEVEMHLKDTSLESSILTHLSSIETAFSLEIFNGFSEASVLLHDIWNRAFYVILQEYRDQIKRNKKLVLSDDTYKHQLDSSIEWITRICKHITHFFQDFIKKTITQVGTTQELLRIMPGLQFWKKDTEPKFHPCPPQMVQYVDSACSVAFCKLGDVTRYQDDYEEEPDQARYRYSEIYYTFATVLDYNDGAPFNQMSKIAYGKKEYFTAIYWILKSVVIDKPFQEDNLSKMANKVVKSKTQVGDILEMLSYQIFLGFLKLVYLRDEAPDSGAINRHLDQMKNAVALHKRTFIVTFGRNITRLTLIAIMLIYTVDDEYERHPLVDYTLEYFGQLAVWAEKLVKQDQQDPLTVVVPSIRILSDWFRKYYQSYERYERDKQVLHRAQWPQINLLNALYSKHGLKFDPGTCAPTLSGQRSLMALDEEKQCLGIAALHGGLNDTPSGMALAENPQSAEQQLEHQLQCIQFSGHELTYLDYMSISWDVQSLQFVSSQQRAEATEEEIDSEEEEEEVVFQGRNTWK